MGSPTAGSFPGPPRTPRAPPARATRRAAAAATAGCSTLTPTTEAAPPPRRPRRLRPRPSRAPRRRPRRSRARTCGRSTRSTSGGGPGRSRRRRGGCGHRPVLCRCIQLFRFMMSLLSRAGAFNRRWPCPHTPSLPPRSTRMMREAAVLPPRTRDTLRFSRLRRLGASRRRGLAPGEGAETGTPVVKPAGAATEEARRRSDRRCLSWALVGLAALGPGAP